jgi:hypothetical protein
MNRSMRARLVAVRDKIKTWIFLTTAIAVMALGLGLCARQQFLIDRCLDAGGRWHADKKQCEGARH